jgi:hypothetical protein
MLKEVLQRQQAQVHDAAKLQQRAEKNAEGHVMALAEGINSLDDDAVKSAGAFTLEEDLARITNADGNWDDSDDEGKLQLAHSASKVTLTSASSSNDMQSEDDCATMDIWDL